MTSGAGWVFSPGTRVRVSAKGGFWPRATPATVQPIPDGLVLNGFDCWVHRKESPDPDSGMCVMFSELEPLS